MRNLYDEGNLENTRIYNKKKRIKKGKDENKSGQKSMEF